MHYPQAQEQEVLANKYSASLKEAQKAQSAAEAEVTKLREAQRRVQQFADEQEVGEPVFQQWRTHGLLTMFFFFVLFHLPLPLPQGPGAPLADGGRSQPGPHERERFAAGQQSAVSPQNFCEVCTYLLTFTFLALRHKMLRHAGGGTKGL